jgi:thioredoxin 1
MEPVIEKFAERFSDVKVAKVNVDEERELAQEYQVLSIPYFALFKDGKLEKHVIGSQPLTKFSQTLMGE